MNNESPMGKNYWLAFVLSMLVLLGYPFLLKKFFPAPASRPDTSQTPAPMAQETAKPLTRPEGPFLEKAAQPSVIHFENNIYEMDFSTLGASIARLVYKGEPDKWGTTRAVFYEGELTEPGLFGIRFLHDPADLTQTVFKLSRHGEKPNEIFTFTYEKPGEYRLVKQYVLGNETPTISLDVSLENLSQHEKHFPLEIVYGLAEDLAHDMARDYEAIVLQDKVKIAHLNQIAKKGFSVTEDISWAGVLKKFYVLLVKPDWKPIANEVTTNSKTLRGTLRMEPVSVEPGQKTARSFLIYAGPQRYETLKEVGVGFEKVFSRGFFGIFKIWLLIALKFLNGFTHNYGWAIILLTLGLKGAFTPLTHMSFESMKKMQALQPKLKSLQERYKKDPAKLNREMMQLYKRNKVNPMGGCLPMLFQIPIFISFYEVLNEAIELKGAPFMFWIQNLAEPDRLFHFPFTLPLLGDSFNLLPLLMIGSMVWQQKLTPQAGATPEQTKMMAFTPLIFGFLFYKMPSGLVLYWFVNNVLSIIHQLFVKRIVVVLHHEDHE